MLEWDAPWAKWFVGGKLNVSHNCLDRHVDAGLGERVAYHWEGEDGERRTITYADLLEMTKRFANVLKELGVERDDRVAIYLPMVPEAVAAMLACARIGAPHSVVFGGFSAEAVKDRINDCEAKVLVTADFSLRRGKPLPMKESIDAVLGELPLDRARASSCAAPAARSRGPRAATSGGTSAVEAASTDCPAEPFDSEQMLYLLYTSGTTAKPKGIVHTSGGYLTGVAATHKLVFDIKPETDVYWCSADIGWVTGHSYIVYGPLANGCTSILYEGAPDYPDKDRWWDIVERYGCTIFYTAPTAIRACIKWGREYPDRHDLSSLRLLGSVGEPINPRAWLWYHEVIGGGRCPIVDTWWQTETGHIMITPLPGHHTHQAGLGDRPVPGRLGRDLRLAGQRGRGGRRHPGPEAAVAGHVPHALQGAGALRRDLLVQVRARDLRGGRRRPPGRGRLLLGRRAHRRRDQRVRPPALDDGGRVGLRLAPAGGRGGGRARAGRDHRPGDRRVRDDGGRRRPARGVRPELREHVGVKIGKLARPKRFIWADDLPKTRSGKIMRRLLRDIASGQEMGDVTTLRDPTVMEQLKDKIAQRQSQED